MRRQAPQICTSTQLHLQQRLGTIRATLSEHCLGQYHDVVLLCMYSDGLWNSHNLARTPNRGGRVNAKTKVCARKHTHAHNRFKPCIHLHFRTCKYIGINVKNTPALTPHSPHTWSVCKRGSLGDHYTLGSFNSYIFGPQTAWEINTSQLVTWPLHLWENVQYHMHTYCTLWRENACCW